MIEIRWTGWKTVFQQDDRCQSYWLDMNEPKGSPSSVSSTDGGVVFKVLPKWWMCAR